LEHAKKGQTKKIGEVQEQFFKRFSNVLLTKSEIGIFKIERRKRIEEIGRGGI
jgi:hypothetical protein